MPQQRVNAEQRVNRMFDSKSTPRRSGVERRATSGKQIGLKGGNAFLKQGAGKVAGAGLARGALRMLGPIGGAASLALSGINLYQRHVADGIEKGGGINSPEAEANRVVSTEQMMQRFRNKQPAAGATPFRNGVPDHGGLRGIPKPRTTNPNISTEGRTLGTGFKKKAPRDLG